MFASQYSRDNQPPSYGVLKTWTVFFLSWVENQNFDYVVRLLEAWRDLI